MVEGYALVGDIGGTNTRLAYVDNSAGTRDKLPSIRRCRSYKNKDFESLTAIIDSYIKIDSIAFDSAVIASAGVVDKGRIVSSNIPWEVSIDSVRDVLNASNVVVLNDLAAMAIGVQFAAAEKMRSVLGRSSLDFSHPVAVLGVGTGFGAAVCIPADSPAPIVLRTEAGQAHFRAVTESEQQLVDTIRCGPRKWLNLDHVLSGPGLASMYKALRKLQGLPHLSLRPTDVVNRASDGDDLLALNAVKTFIDTVLRYAADLSMTYGALGGVVFVGGVMPKLAEFLPKSGRSDSFTVDGPLASLMNEVPLLICQDDYVALLGAASSANASAFRKEQRVNYAC